MCYSSDNLNIIRPKKCHILSEYLANKSSESEINEIVTGFNPLDLMNLSYNPNPNLPFMADCVNIFKNGYESNVLIAKIPLNVGDVIAIESSFCNVLGYDSRYEICSKCMKKVPFALIPCDNCTDGEKLMAKK